MVYKAALFDLGDVLFSTNWKFINQTLEEKVGIPIFPKEGRYEFYFELQKGVIKPKDYFRLLMQAAGKKVAFDIIYKAYTDAYIESTKLNDDVIGLVKLLRKNLKLIGFSTTNIIHEKVNRERGLFDNFDQVYLSHRLGLLGKDFINAVVKFSGFSVKDLVYVDNLQESCDYANELGISVIKFESIKQLKSRMKHYIITKK